MAIFHFRSLKNRVIHLFLFVYTELQKLSRVLVLFAIHICIHRRACVKKVKAKSCPLQVELVEQYVGFTSRHQNQVIIALITYVIIAVIQPMTNTLWHITHSFTRVRSLTNVDFVIFLLLKKETWSDIWWPTLERNHTDVRCAITKLHSLIL